MHAPLLPGGHVDAEDIGPRCLTASSNPGSNSQPNSLDDSRTAQLVRYGAYIFLWVLGTAALIKLMTDFSSTLKPLVLAALVASILEWMVQLWEWLLWKIGNFLCVVLHKVKAVIFFSLILFKESVKRLCSLCCARFRQLSFRQSMKEPWHNFSTELKEWSLLRKRWHGSYAGQNTLARFIAVIVTLGFVALVWVCAYYLVMMNISDMLNKLDDYKSQVLKVITYASKNVNRLPDFMPKEYQNTTRDALARLDNYLQADTLIHQLASYVSTLLGGIVAQTGSLAMQVVFFFLYLFLWLFVPMHVNQHAEKAKTFTILPFRLRLNKADSQDSAKDETLMEAQEMLYKVIREYFMALVFINAVYAISVLALLYHLGVDLYGAIAIFCFFMGFIPELGAIIATIVPTILVIFEPLEQETPPVRHDGGVFENPFADWSMRVIKTGKVLLGMVLIKLLVANVLTSIIMGRNKTLAGGVKHQRGRARTVESMEKEFEEEVKETHPVLLLFVVVLSGEIWGVVGMLISVPVVSLVRLALNVWFLPRCSKEE